MTQTSTPAPMPAIYIPHGGGPAFFMQGQMRSMFQATADFLTTIAAELPERPRAILVATAHWQAPVTTLTGGDRPPLIYDYSGFPPETYQLTYPAPGDPQLAEQAATLLTQAGVEALVDSEIGWDHGVFIPLKVMYPNADIPVVAMSLTTGLDPAAHRAVGRALAPLRRDGVLIVGSGMSYHNPNPGPEGAAASIEFDDWLDDSLSQDELSRSRSLADWEATPSARHAHPYEDHLLPLMVTSAAGGDSPARKVWRGAVADTRVSAWAFD